MKKLFDKKNEKYSQDLHNAGNAMKENIANLFLGDNTTIMSSEYENNVSIFEIICDKIKKQEANTYVLH